LLENDVLPGHHKALIEAFTVLYKHYYYHEILSNVTPAGARFGRGRAILLQRE